TLFSLARSKPFATQYALDYSASPKYGFGAGRHPPRAVRVYLYANYLIIQCQEAAVRISPKTWEEIESRMLVVPDNSTL
ncbi:hypothetical protein QUB18_25165, partial [Microcoleus sp. B3-D3]